ncbi:transposase family protein [Symbiopectobacterium purcellii]|uniref:transposase family protein n=1 Tax=Symbiopectobacterium purcellii TaxID=2871826 RepID=UPI003F85BAC8
MKFYNAYINQYLKLFNKAIIRHIPPEVTIWADTGFQGIDKQHPNTQIPKKGTRKRPLSPEQKQENKIISGDCKIICVNGILRKTFKG